jgi:hypothetical protein
MGFLGEKTKKKKSGSVGILCLLVGE